MVPSSGGTVNEAAQAVRSGEELTEAAAPACNGYGRWARQARGARSGASPAHDFLMVSLRSQALAASRPGATLATRAGRGSDNLAA
jgi:hypothetical protein